MALNTDINIIQVGEDILTLDLGQDYIELGAVAVHTPSGEMLEVSVIGSIDTGTYGDQYITYRAEYKGDYNEKIRQVVIRDTVPPVIVLKEGYGENIYWPYGTSITEEDVVSFVDATDNVDGDMSGNLAISYFDPETGIEVELSFLDIDRINHRIKVRYEVVDGSGNAAVPLECFVNIKPSIAPTITLSGSTNLELDVYEVYIEPGYTATDALGEDISHRIIATVNGESLNLVQDTITNAPGIKIINYEVTDQWGNTTSATRTLYIASEKNPVIVLLVDTVEIERGYSVDDSYFYKLISVVDYVDGHKLVHDVVVDSSALNTSEHGGYDITFNVTNSIGLSSKEEIMRVDVVNKTEAIHTLYPDLVTRDIDFDEVYTKDMLLAGVIFRDYKNNVISKENIEVDMQDIDLKGPGTYILYYRAEDFTGLKTRWIEATVVKRDTTKPTIINANPTETVEVNSVYTTAMALTGVTGLTHDGVDISSNLVVDMTALDTATVGTYDIVYSLENPFNGVNADVVTRAVTVVDPNG